MTKTDWNALAAAERAVRDRMQALLEKDFGSSGWPKDDWRAAAYHVANLRLGVFAELGERDEIGRVIDGGTA